MKKIVLMLAVVALFAYTGVANASMGATTYGKKCSGCHGKAGVGTPMAPALAGSDFVKDGGAPLKDVLTTGKSAAGKSHPKSSLSEAEIDSIIDYLHSL